MKEFVEKLIERLEEVGGAEAAAYICGRCNGKTLKLGYINGIEKAIEIVKDLAEEHSHCMLCYLGSPCEYQNAEISCEKCDEYNNEEHYCPKFCKVIEETVKEIKEEHNNGWISVEDKLPPRNESVLCWAVSLARGGDCCCLGSCDNGFWFMQTQIDTYSFPQQYKVVAWHKLPAPYKKGE